MTICRASATLRRGDKRLAGFHMGLCLWKVPAVESLSRLRRQLPLAREPCGQCPLTISHGSFLLLVLSLTRPVSVACPPNFFTIHSSLFPKKARSCYCGGNRSANQSPPCQRGVVWRSQTGGIKGWKVSTWVCAYGKCLLWNPSVAFGASSLWQGSLAGSAR